MILIVFFVPPLYFMMRNRWGEFFLNSIPYGIACLFLLSIFGAWLAPFFWIPSVAHAGWQWRHEMVHQMMSQQADLIATKMAAQFQAPARSAQSPFCPNCGRPVDPGSGICSCSSPAFQARPEGPINQS